MQVHQLCHLFNPDELAGAALYTDLARYLRDRGHDVRVTTTFSYYPALRYAETDRGVWRREELFNGIPVRRLGMWLPASHKGGRRLLPEATFLGNLAVNGRFPGWTPNVVIAACPMLAQPAVLRFLYPGKSIPRLVVVQDLMANAATELGIIRSRTLGRFLHAFERWAFGAATVISTISGEMQERIHASTRGKVPCVVTPNWVHQSLRDTIEQMRPQILRKDANRLFYSGNFGVKQGLPGFLRDFKSMRGDWTINLHGAGAEADTLARETLGWDSWLKIGPLLEEALYVERLLTATACVVTQMPGVGANFLPSKLLPALAAGTPVLAICEPDSPLGREVLIGGFGAVVRPGDREMLRSVLEHWRQKPEALADFGAAALKRAELYSRERSCGAYEQLLLDMVDGSKRQTVGGVRDRSDLLAEAGRDRSE